jgi:hypothetical protein
MQKTPTIFIRDFDHNPKLVTEEKNPVCDWVFNGEGQATRKYDGTCCYFDGDTWFKRREIKPGKKAPDDFRPVNTDPVTGKMMGWVPVGPDDKWHNEAIAQDDGYAPGTYELCGPKVQGNPEGYASHVLIAHADAEVFDVPRDYQGIQEWMKHIPFEGIVFHHPDGRMAKIKRRDFDIA